MFFTYSARGLQKKTPQREPRGVSFYGEVPLDRADRTPHRDQPTALLEFNRSAGGTPPHRAPLNMGAVYERLIADRPVAVPIATPDQSMPSGASPKNVPEVRRSGPFASSADNIHRQPVAMPCIMRGGTLGDRPATIVVIPPKAIQERLAFVGTEGFKDLRGVPPRRQVFDDPIDGILKSRGQHRQIRLHRHFSRGSRQFTHLSILPSMRLTRSLMSRVRV